MLKKLIIVFSLLLSTIVPYLHLDHAFAQISGNATTIQSSANPTSISGIIYSDTTWTVKNSPYTLTGDVQVAYGATLTIEPGVVINGQGKNLTIFGNLNAVGVTDSKINFQNIKILGGRSQSNTEFYQITIQHSTIDSSRILPTGYNSSNDGSLILRDSVITNLTFMLDLEYPSSDSYIERNIFKDSYGIITRTQNSTKVFIKNNVFYRQKNDYAVMNLYTDGTSETVVQHNSFLSTDRVALRLGMNSSSAKMTATENFFNTTDPSIIDSMIFDKKDDLSIASTIAYQPFLSTPNPDTPNLDLVVVNQTYPLPGAANVPVNQSLDITYSHNILEGPKFSNITVKDSQNHLVPYTATINANKLQLTPNSKMNYNTKYTVTIPMAALKDLSGNDIDNYTFNFTTQLEKGTTVSGIIDSNTTWTLENSPYILTGDTQLTYGTTLTIEPGVIIDGQGKNFTIFGNLKAVGLFDSKINLKNINILGGRSQSNTEFYQITIQHSNIDSSRILPTGYNSSNDGSLILRDSVITNLTFMLDLDYPSSHSYIERNIFKDSYGIITRTQNSTKVFINNNVFYRQKNGYAIMNLSTNGTSETIVNQNTFLNTDLIALRLGINSSYAKMTATDNYFNTTDPSIIDSMIYDKNDDLSIASAITYQPYLINQNWLTPNYDGFHVNGTNPVQDSNTVSPTEQIEISYTGNIVEGSNFSNITFQNTDGTPIEFSTKITNNKLSLIPNPPLKSNKGYKVFIPSGALKDSGGTSLLLAYHLSFSTKDEGNKVTAVTVKSNMSSPQMIGTPITFSASSSGSNEPEYRFYIRDTANGTLSLLQDYSTKSSAVWTPTKAGKYQIITHAKDISKNGGSLFYEARTDLTYHVIPERVTSVSVDIDQTSPTIPGDAIKLTASSNGSKEPVYRFYVRDIAKGTLTLLQDYSSSTSTTWIPAKAGKYQFVVHAKDKSSTLASINYEARSELAYQVVPGKVSSVSVSTDQASPTITGTSIKISASSTGSNEPVYRFYAKDLDKGTLTLLQDYSASNTYEWKPAMAGKYQIIVHSKDKNNTAIYVNYEARTELAYQVIQAKVTSVEAEADPASPAAMGTPINITATSQGSNEPEYRFYIYDISKGTLTLLQEYSSSNNANWTPSKAGNYKIIVHAKDKSKSGANYYNEARTEIRYQVM